MPLARSSLERQLQQASADLESFTKSLDAQGVAAGDRRSLPKWRTLNARCTQLRSRLAAVAAVESRDEETARRKAEGAGSTTDDE
jgi:hypothetical protein